MLLHRAIIVMLIDFFKHTKEVFLIIKACSGVEDVNVIEEVPAQLSRHELCDSTPLLRTVGECLVVRQ